MANSLPPLDQLRAFEAAARYLSFKKAADELGVTPAAIGQRVRTLETFLGIQLFVRRTRQIHLTREGKKLQTAAANGLQEIRNGISSISRQDKNQQISVSTTHSFAEMLLLPKLPNFKAIYPDSDVRIITTDENLNPALHQVDICIRFGRGSYAGCNSKQLTKNTYIPICAPSLLEKYKEITSPQDLLSLPLIEAVWDIEHTNAPSWHTWCKQRGLNLPKRQPQLKISAETHAIKSAIAGHGVALVNNLFIEDEITRGLLVKLLPQTGEHQMSFHHHLVWRPNEFRQTILNFLDWCTDEFTE